MKRIIFGALLATIAIFAIVNRSNATVVSTDPSSLEITLKNGSKVTYASSQLDSIVYVGGFWGETGAVGMKVYVRGASSSVDYLFSQVTDIDFDASVVVMSDPTFSVESGHTFYNNYSTVTISTETEGATVYYTTNGTTPSATNNAGSGVGSVVVTVTEDMTIKAIAILGEQSSEVVTASYTIGESETLVYKRITSTSDLEVGKRYIIVSEEGGAAMGAITGTSTKYGVSVTPSTDATFTLDVTNHTANVSSGSNVKSVTLGGSEGAWTLVHEDGGYLYWSSGNSLNTSSQSSNNITWAISFGTDSVAIKNVANTERHICYNKASGQERFACYTTAQTKIQLYKESDEAAVVTVDAPTFSPESGHTFTEAENTVTISSTSTGSTIYYTTDGSDPTTSSSHGTAGAATATVTVTSSCTVKAIAVKDGTSSEVASASYTVNLVTDGTLYTLVTSTGDLEEGKKYIFVYEDGNAAMGAISDTSTKYGTSVTDTDDDYFTLDTDTHTATLKEGTSVKYVTLGGSSGAWTFTHEDGGTLNWSSGNSLTTGDSGNTWTIAIGSNGDATITNVGTSERVIKYNTGSPRFACYTSGQKLFQIYKENGSAAATVKTPTFSVSSRTLYNTTTSVTISTATSGATVYYTTDDTEPSATNYAGKGTNSVSLTITASMTVKAIAILDGESSSVASATYTVDTSGSSSGDGNVNRNSLSSYYNSSKYMYRLEWPHIRENGNQTWLAKSESGYGLALEMEWDNSLIANRFTCYYMDSKNSVQNVSRSDSFKEDPEVPSATRSTLSDYSGSGFSRGHLCPSADRRASNAQQALTYYLSNMQPQYQTHNGAQWATLEANVRTWAAQFDTLYVVKAGTIENVTINGSTKSGIKSVKCNNRLIVPEYFYMALMGYKKSTNTYTAVGIWTYHYNDSGDKQDEVYMSIDELETRTGIDFFCNLPDEVEETVEASYDSSKWQ